MEGFDLSRFLMFMLAFVLAITVHEFAHAITADRLGDGTPRSQGRLTLAPTAHLDPMGTLLMAVSAVAGIGIGWGRPVLTNPNNYVINRRVADSLVSFAGPASNMVLAVLFALVFRSDVFAPGDAFRELIVTMVLVNVSLFFFNLIPLYPLDGSHLLANSMPPAMAEGYYRFVTRWGIFLFLALVLSGLLSPILGPPVFSTFEFLLGAG